MIAPVHSSHTTQPAREVGFLDIWTAQVSGNPVFKRPSQYAVIPGGEMHSFCGLPVKVF